MDPLKIYQFDGEQIEKVLALGYQDRETFLYMHALQGKIDEIKRSAAENYEKAKAEAEADAQTDDAE